MVMIRHAQSQWNRENRFTGSADPPLTKKGVAEARQAAEALRALIMKLSGMTIAEVETFEIPTATPIIYHFNRLAEPLGRESLGDAGIDLAMSA